MLKTSPNVVYVRQNQWFEFCFDIFQFIGHGVINIRLETKPFRGALGILNIYSWNWWACTV